MEELFGNLVAVAGMNWIFALAIAFVAMILESARPKPADGERENLTLPRFIAMVCGTLTPFLLFAHAVGAGTAAGHSGSINLVLEAVQSSNYSSGPGAAIIAGAVLVVVVVLVASVVGTILAAAAPGLGHALQTPAPLVSIAAFAFTAFVSWRLAWAAIDFYLSGRT